MNKDFEMQYHGGRILIRGTGVLFMEGITFFLDFDGWNWQLENGQQSAADS